MPEFSFVSARFGSETKTPHRHEPALLLETRNFWLIATMPVSFTLTAGPTLPVVMSVIVVAIPPAPPAPLLDELVPELLLLLVLVDALLVVFVLPLALSPPAPPEFELPSLRQPAMDDHTVS